MTKKYTNVNEIIAKVEQLITDLKKDDIQILPSERKLAKEVGCSVMTLRKALSALEERGLFIKSNGVRMLTANLPSGENPVSKLQELKVVYIAQGQAVPANITWLRTSVILSEKMREKNIDFSVMCLPATETAKSLTERFIEMPDVIILAHSPNLEIQSKILSMRDQCLIIGIDENMIGKCECVVALNNYHAGYLAGKKLLEAGCKKPAMNYTDKGYFPFYQRRDGFIDALLEAGIDIEGCVLKTKSPGESSPGNDNLFDVLKDICQTGHDGFFLFSDNLSQYAKEVISESHKVPKEFKLITLDANGEYSGHDIISAVSHGLEETADKIIENIEAFASGRFFEKISLIDSKYIPGTTL